LQENRVFFQNHGERTQRKTTVHCIHITERLGARPQY